MPVSKLISTLQTLSITIFSDSSFQVVNYALFSLNFSVMVDYVFWV